MEKRPLTIAEIVETTKQSAFYRRAVARENEPADARRERQEAFLKAAGSAKINLKY